MSDVRCTSCGGLNPQGALWCGQCFARFGAPSAPLAEPAVAAAEVPGEGGAPSSLAPVATAGTPFGVSGRNVTWMCGACGTNNTYVADACGGCGISFAASLELSRKMEPAAILGRMSALPASGFFERVRRGFRLIGVSWQALKLDPELMVFPGAAAVVSLLVAFAIATQVPPGARGDLESALSTPMLWLFYFAMYLIGCWCQAAVVAGALMRFSGRDPSLGDGASTAFRKLLPLTVWAAIACTIALALRALEERSKWAARIAGIAWSSVSFFVIPVIVAEDVGAGAALKRSNRLFRERWGETLLGTFGMGIAFSLLMFAVIAVALGVAMYVPLLGLIIGAVGIIAVVVVGSTLSAIFNAALYRYAVGGEAAAPFSEALLARTFSARGFKPIFA